MDHRAAFVLGLLLTLSGAACTQHVRVDSSRPIYAKPTLSLHEKSESLDAAIQAWCVDEDGLLLWRCLPTRDQTTALGWRRGKRSEPRWQESYNMADMPAWQGQFLSALAFKWAATGENQEHRILHALGALERCYEVTGVPGLLTRSYVLHSGDRALPWMRTEKATRQAGALAKGYWQPGRGGYWFRNGVAGGHHQGVFTALCVLGAFQRDGAIQLSEGAALRIQAFLQPLYDRIRTNGYRIIDVDDRATGYGNMSVYHYNPQYALWQLTLNQAAILWEVTAPGATEPSPKVEYARLKNGYGEIIQSSYGIVAAALKRFEVDDRLLKANDIHWGHHAWLGLLVANGPESSKHMRDIRRGFAALWDLHDPFNMHNYVIQRHGRPRLRDRTAHAYARSAFEWYPINKFTFEDQSTRNTDKWQPIQNRKISTSYAKGRPFNRARVGESNGGLRTGTYQCGFDYLLNYWMSEYFGTFSEDETAAAE